MRIRSGRYLLRFYCTFFLFFFWDSAQGVSSPVGKFAPRDGFFSK